VANFETEQGANRRRAFTLLAGLFVILAGLSWSLGGYLGAGGSSLILIVTSVSTAATWVSWWKADAIVLRMTRARVVDAHDYPQLHNIVEEVCLAAGLPKPRVAIVDDPAPNAFATGRDPDHALVAVTTGLLERMDREELQGVVAHELAHVANRDTLVMTIAATTAGIIALISDIGLRLAFSSGRRSSRRSKDSGGGGALLLFVLIGAILAPIAAALLKSALSRSREGLADATAVKFTRNPAGLRRALQRLAVDSTVVQARSNATAHLWIESPLDESRAINRWYSTHPPITERIQTLWELEGNVGHPPPLPLTGDASAAGIKTSALDPVEAVPTIVTPASKSARWLAVGSLALAISTSFAPVLAPVALICSVAALRLTLGQAPSFTRKLAVAGIVASLVLTGLWFAYLLSIV
jgi:heat shock protein HtpX